jgi:hypothetical protein
MDLFGGSGEAAPISNGDNKPNSYLNIFSGILSAFTKERKKERKQAKFRYALIQ